MNLIKKAFLFFFLFVWFASPEARADDGEVFIDPADPTVIRQTIIPLESQVILRISELPSRSVEHPNVQFQNMKFTHIALSPDGNTLAWVAHGLMHGWVGIYSLKDKSFRELTLRFESAALFPAWSPDGRYLYVEEVDANDRRSVAVFSVDPLSQCLLSGKTLKNKFFNVLNPWWSKQGGKVYFQVDINNDYRKVLGLKPLKEVSKIGEASPDCQNIVLRTVPKFMAEVPSDPPPEGVLAAMSPQEGVSP